MLTAPTVPAPTPQKRFTFPFKLLADVKTHDPNLGEGTIETIYPFLNDSNEIDYLLLLTIMQYQPWKQQHGDNTRYLCYSVCATKSMYHLSCIMYSVLRAPCQVSFTFFYRNRSTVVPALHRIYGPLLDSVRDQLRNKRDKDDKVAGCEPSNWHIYDIIASLSSVSKVKYSGGPFHYGFYLIPCTHL